MELVTSKNQLKLRTFSKDELTINIWSWRLLWSALKDRPGGEFLWNLNVDAPLKWMNEYIDGRGTSYMSKDAKKLLMDLGVPEEEFVKTINIYKIRDKYDKSLLDNTKAGANTKKIVREHMIPRKMLREMIKDTTVPPEEIVERCKIAIITKEEDDRLQAAGYRQKRPNGVMYCYRDCNIDLIELK